jgi:hypothetical protein
MVDKRLIVDKMVPLSNCAKGIVLGWAWAYGCGANFIKKVPFVVRKFKNCSVSVPV